MTEETKEGSVKICFEKEDEINLFYALNSEATAGTAYDYFTKFPNMEEELYYLLQCATREDAPESEVVAMCQQVVDKRNSDLLENFAGKSTLEQTIDLADLIYDDSPDLSKLEICQSATKWDEKEQPAFLLHQSRDTSPRSKHDP